MVSAVILPLTVDDVRARYAQWIQVDCTHLLAGAVNNTHLSQIADYMRLPVVADSTRLPPVMDSSPLPPVVDSTHFLPECY